MDRDGLYQAVALQEITVRGRREARHADTKVWHANSRLYQVELRVVLRISIDVLGLWQLSRCHSVERQSARQRRLNQREARGVGVRSRPWLCWPR